MTAIINDFAAIRSAADGAQKGDDAEILSLFQQWIVELRAADLIENDDEAWDAQLKRSDKIEDQICAVPSIGAAGLAIKFYLALRVENGARDDSAALESTNTFFELAALRDAVRFVPELVPLCAAVLEEREDEADEQPSAIADLPAVDASAAIVVIPTASDDPVAAMWVERNRLDRLATEADIARDEDLRDELDDQRMAIEDQMPRTRATTIAGILAQVELQWRRVSFVECEEDKLLLSTIRAGLVDMQARVAPSLDARLAEERPV
jgi:hypothetical protein